MKNQSELPRYITRLTQNTLALILAGGQGTRLKGLTSWRAKPAVPFGGKFRIIDFPLSNCINSGIRKVGVLTQYKAHSLILHIQNAWSFLRSEIGEFIELLPAQQRIESSWYAGTADAVYQNIDIIRNHNPTYILILAGDHVYKMDYGPMIAFHVEHQADMTIGSVQVPLEEAKSYGVMSANEDGRVLEFHEKPQNPQPMPGNSELALASMGIYLFNSQFLFEQLFKDADTPKSEHDFGKNIIPPIIKKYSVYTYAFQNQDTGDQNYWRDVGTIDSFWDANIELADVTPQLNLYDAQWPIWTYQEQLPPAKFIFNDEGRRGMAVDSLVSGGCIISGAHVERSVLFSNVTISSYTRVENSVILPQVKIGKNCLIKKAVIDKGCVIPDDTSIGVNLEEDRKRFEVSEGGVVLVTAEMMGISLHHVR